MKILGSVLGALALGNILPEDDGSNMNSNTVIMINMNTANVQELTNSLAQSFII